MEELEFSDFQYGVMFAPEDVNLFLGGGRGSGKSTAMIGVALKHIAKYGERARIQYIRQTYKGLRQFEEDCYRIFDAVFRRQAVYNVKEHIWRFPNGATLDLGQLEGHRDLGKYQGHSISLLLIDEAGLYGDPSLLDRLQGGLRAPEGVPSRVVLAANPGDVGHVWLANRYATKPPFKKFLVRIPGEDRDLELPFYNCPSTFRENPFINQARYESQLRAACAGDPELLHAWLEGDWSVIRGAFFASVLSDARVALPVIDPAAFEREGWRLSLAHDYGSTAPSVTYISGRSPGAELGGRWVAKGSLVLLDELATVAPGEVNQGLGWTIPRLAEEIQALARRWGIPPSGVADDAIFARTGHTAGGIADEFRQFGVYFEPAGKGLREAGWERMRRMLEAAVAEGAHGDAAALYVSRACSYWWQTVPYLARDPRKASDVDSAGPDHAADATRYAVVANVGQALHHFELLF